MADAVHPNPALPGTGYIDPAAAHAHSPHVAHHFDTAEQQFDSGKLGMWLFLATEVLLFGGLFCAYAVWRGNHPELFIHGHHHLDKTMGAINTVVLLLSSFTMAWAVTSAQRGNQFALRLGLALTLLGGATFMVIKYFEYKKKIDHGLLWGKYYNPKHDEEHHGSADATLHAPPAPHTGRGAPAIETPTPPHPQSEIQKNVEAQQHAPSASAPLGTHSAEAQPPSESATPAATSAPASDSAESEKSQAHPEAGAHDPQGSGAGVAAPAAAPPATAWTPRGVSAGALQQLNYEPTKILPAATPPAGLKSATPMREPEPQTLRTFFSIYFCMTGLHGIHVLAGMGLIAWLLVRSFQGAFGPDYFTPVDLGGLYWHLVDLIWIYLFPLLYLIH